MNLDSLVELNDLSSPYHIFVGQKIRIHKYHSTDLEKTDSEKISYQTNISKNYKNSENNILQQDIFNRTSDRLAKFSWPLYGEVISKFGPKTQGLFNDGINIKGKIGETVKAAEDGVVSYVGNELKGYGNLIIIKHSGGWITAYAHLSKFSVKKGQKVKRLAKIGEVGNSGNVDSAQLYFGLRKGRNAVNPENYLSK
jgi:murein DD-endopeptidase MepM/ murein hydrolase activator NlpD